MSTTQQLLETLPFSRSEATPGLYEAISEAFDNFKVSAEFSQWRKDEPNSNARAFQLRSYKIEKHTEHVMTQALAYIQHFTHTFDNFDPFEVFKHDPRTRIEFIKQTQALTLCLDIMNEYGDNPRAQALLFDNVCAILGFKAYDFDGSRI